ncbi:hypothetical protein K469DRAFT_783722 [Zopfia rhizophila CBS 207.26]|uniref:Uncharacterized protein n=1 Tax=Zopfia rhizophila CBS 207.26 TaxID=1314779 RepID=A0A6A6E0K4_9PEZI|nr:hypothetical protein K469DRAFT_783722 [Zopfia rhizophila CBS 207.26]
MTGPKINEAAVGAFPYYRRTLSEYVQSKERFPTGLYQPVADNLEIRVLEVDPLEFNSSIVSILHHCSLAFEKHADNINLTSARQMIHAVPLVENTPYDISPWAMHSFLLSVRAQPGAIAIRNSSPEP